MDEMPLDDDLDAPEITVPLQPPPRPAPTIMHPTLASRLAPPPVRQPGSGLLAKNVGAPAHATPSFLPPPKECSPALPPPAPRPAGGFPRTQGKAPPPPPPPARPVFQPQAPKVEAKPAAPPPMRQAGGGLLARNVGAPARARPSFLPPPRERSPALLQASPRAVEDQGPAFEMVDGVMTHVRPAPASVRPPARQHAPDNSNFFTAFEARHAYPGGFPRATAAPAANAEAKHPAAILPPLPERPRVSMNDTPKFDKDGRPLGPKVALKRHVAPQSLSPDDIPFD
jgi:hypothetical protein